MKPVAAFVVAVCSAAAAVADQPVLTAAEVVQRNADARGGREAWRKIETMAWTGRVESAKPGAKAPFVLEMKRPDRTRFEVVVNGQKSVRVFDGTNGWKMRIGATGRPEVQPYTPDELKFARGVPVIDGPLLEYAARGATISLEGVHELEGRKAFALALRLPSGTSYRVWIDAETFLELRYDREFVNAQGRPAVTSVYFADYQKVEGLLLPLAIETGSPDGKTRDKLVIERVALNPGLDDRAFAKPGPTPARRRGVTVDARSAPPGNPARPVR